ncbi:MAG: allose kinase [Eubacteriales bacterium]
MKYLSDKKIIGVDIGGTKLRIGLFKNGKIFNFKCLNSKDLFYEGDELYNLYVILSEYINEVEKGISAISIGFPSPVSIDRKIVLNVPNIIKKDGVHAFSGKNVVGYLKSKLNIPILINKDTSNLLINDIHSVKDSSGVIIGCYFGTGIGAAIAIDGQILSGKNGVAAEIGHIPFYMQNRLCNCGNIGCAECYASGRELKNIIDTSFNGYTIDDVFKHNSDDERIYKWIEAVCVTVATAINLLDPRIVFLGGGVFSGSFPKDMFLDCLKAHVMAPLPRNGLDIRFSKQDSMSGVLGAAYYALETI